MSVTFEIQETEVPAETAGRTAEPNPFDGKFPTAEGRALTIVLDGDKEANKSVVTRLTGQARKAANAHELTARVKVDEVKQGKKVQTQFITWSRPKITRPRGTENSDAALSAANPNTATE